MVEGHQVHRIKAAHVKALKGKKFAATSPNGRFADGAAAINAAGGILADVTAVGKNLFYVFGAAGNKAADQVVVRVHFGMSGRHSAFHRDEEPAPTPTTRLRLEGTDAPVVTHLSAMTVEHGGPGLLAAALAALGPDPLREDADKERFWAALQASRRSVGHELMRQEAIAGVGNIFRAEICHFARLHPDTPAEAVDRPTFEAVWAECVRQLRAGFELGSILTVPEHARPGMVDKAARRAVYNRPRCATCGGRVVSWDINARTAYACEACQPRHAASAAGGAGTPAAAEASKKRAPRLFTSKCAPEASSPGHLTVAQLKAALAGHGVADTKGMAKAALVARLEAEVARGEAVPTTPLAAKRGRTAPRPGTAGLQPANADAAAAEKAAAGEGKNVEHVPQAAGDATVWLAKKAKGKVKVEGEATGAGPATPAPGGGKQKTARKAKREAA
jgi:formamidopyrimidine-DNA glycosylase